MLNERVIMFLTTFENVAWYVLLCNTGLPYVRSGNHETSVAAPSGLPPPYAAENPFETWPGDTAPVVRVYGRPA